MEQLVHMFRLQAEAKGLIFIYECKDRLPEFVRTDEKRLRQILINLLSNAIKYTDKGSVIFKLRYRSQVAEFTITDTGEGIAPENIERIFRPFERVRRPGSTETGTGLGLTITRLLSEIMGGDIAVTSSIGSGSTFKASLMLASISKPHPEFITAPVQTIYGYKGAVRTLMLVDDEASHRQLMRAMLAPLGFEIIALDNPLLALDRLMQEIDMDNCPDLIMLDVSMPGINGWQLAKQLRAAGYHSPIIMVSADASEGKDLPAHDNTDVAPLHDAYVIKPVRINLLLEHIGRLLNLVWCYEQQEADTPAPQLIGTLELPADKHLDDIAHLAAIGHKKGLQDKIQELEKTGSAHPNFIQELKKLTANFQFEKILALVDAAINTETNTEIDKPFVIPANAGIHNV